MALLLVQIVVGVGLAVWLWRCFVPSSALRQLQTRTIAVVVLGSLVVMVIIGAAVAVGLAALASAVILVLGVGGIAIAAVRSRHR